MAIDRDLLHLDPEFQSNAMSPHPKKDKKQGRPLSDDFTPGNYDVICAKGKAVHNHIGKLKLHQKSL